MNSDKHILKVRTLAACVIITVPAAIRKITGIEAGDYVYAEANGKRGFTVTKGAYRPVKKKAAAVPKKKAVAKKKVLAPAKKKATAAPKKKILAAPAKKAAVKKIALKPPVKKILAPKAPEQQPLPLGLTDTDN